MPSRVNVKGGTAPTGTISITQNGTVDVNVVDTDLVGLVEGSLVTINNANITKVRAYAFYSNTVIEEVVLPNATTIIQNAFRYATALKKVDVPSLINLGNDVFRNCSALQLFIVGKNVTNIYSNCFRDSGLKTIILKRENAITVASSLDIFTNTPFRNGVGGVAYVPYSLKSTYENATNWSTLKAESTTFKSIQENLATLHFLGVDITDYYFPDFYASESELPSSNINTNKVYLVDTAVEGTYDQYYNPNAISDWSQCKLADPLVLEVAE